MSSLVSMRPRFLPEKRVGALFEQQLQPSAPLLNWFGDRSGASEGRYACLPGSSILSGVLARIPEHPSLKIRQQSVLCSAHAIITLLRIYTNYYVLLRIFLQKSCFMMSFIVFTYYYVLILVSTYYRRCTRQCLEHRFRAGL